MNELTKVMCDIFYNALKLCSRKRFFLFSLHIIILKSIRKKLILIAIFLFKKILKFRMEVQISTKYQLQRYTEIVTRNSSTAYNNSIGLGSTPGELLRTTCVSRRGETFFCRFAPTVRVYNKARHSLLTFCCCLSSMFTSIN